ncbi:MAG: hypothetical protein NTY71_04520 [Methanoregula sp.]|nr:hypothetical protein [Methanoregula sp.]
MNDSLRRRVIFCVMVSTGTLLIFFNLPLLFILPLVAALGFLLLILGSPVPVAELKSAVSSLNTISFIRRHREKKTPLKMAEPVLAEAKKQEPAPIIKEKKRGLSLHINSMISSFKAVGTFLTVRKKTERKNVDEIDKLLDEMISDKVNLSIHEFNANMMKESAMPTAMPTGGGAGRNFPLHPPARPEDPFLSLSSDELETGLLDSLDEDEDAGVAFGSGDDTIVAGAPADTTSAGLAISEPDMPIPPQDVSSEAAEIPVANEPDLEEFSPLEGTDTIEENLGELDTIDLGDAEFDEDLVDTQNDAASASFAPSTPPGGEEGVTEPAVSVVQQPSLDVIPAQAPADPADMTAFTAIAGSDNDMLNSLAGDAKTVKKTQNMSLLRELRDFQEPAKEIESELTEIYAALNTTVKRKRKTKLS